MPSFPVQLTPAYFWSFQGAPPPTPTLAPSPRQVEEAFTAEGGCVVAAAAAAEPSENGGDRESVFEGSSVSRAGGCGALSRKAAALAVRMGRPRSSASPSSGPFAAAASPAAAGQASSSASSSGVILLGETFTGKSTLLRAAARLCGLGRERVVSVFPAAYSPRQKFGRVAGEEWRDGVLTSVLRRLGAAAAASEAGGIGRDGRQEREDLADGNEANGEDDAEEGGESSSSNAFWLVLQGPLDAQWGDAVEKMLDDRFLDLESGEHLRIPEEVSIIFETDTVERVRNELSMYRNMNSKWHFSLGLLQHCSALLQRSLVAPCSSSSLAT